MTLRSSFGSSLSSVVMLIQVGMAVIMTASVIFVELNGDLEKLCDLPEVKKREP